MEPQTTLSKNRPVLCIFSGFSRIADLFCSNVYRVLQTGRVPGTRPDPEPGPGKIRRVGSGTGCEKKIRFGCEYNCIPGPGPVSSDITEFLTFQSFTIFNMK